MVQALPLRALAGIAAFVVVLSASLFATGAARADANRPRWTAGDYWVYSRTSDNRTTRYDVVGPETVTLSQAYAAFHLRKSVTMISGSTNVTVTTDEWVREGDLAIVKSVAVVIATQTVTFDPPLTQASFPLSAGKSWTVQTAVHLVWGFIDTTVTLSGDASVLSEGPLTVPAGSFTAVAVRENGALNQLGGAHSVLYFSETSGNWVKRETYNANDQRTTEEVLTSYRCQSCFSLVLVIVVIAVLAAAAIVGLLVLRKRGSRAPPPTPETRP